MNTWTEKLAGLLGIMQARAKREVKDWEVQRKNILVEDLRVIIEKQNYLCAYTGKILLPQNIFFVFRTPLLRGGRYTTENIGLVVQEIADAKGKLAQDEFVGLCKSVVANAKKSHGGS